MAHLSIYEMRSKTSKDKILDEVQKRKNSSAQIGCLDFFLEYDISLIEKVFNLTKNAEKFKSSFYQLNAYSQKLILRSAALDELELIFKDHFIPLTKKGIIISWVNDRGDSNSYFVDAYKNLLNESLSLPKTVNDLKRIYDSYVSPRNLAFHQKKIKKFHIFRSENISLNNKTNFIENYQPNFDESEIIKNMSSSLEILNGNLDVFTQSAAFFFFVFYSMPFYNENFFLAKYILSLDLLLEGHAFLGLSIGKVIDKYKDALIRKFNETISSENHKDLSHFVSFFLDIYQDGLSSLPMDLKIKENLAKEDISFFNTMMSKSEKLLLEKIAYATYFSDYGVDVKELKEETCISVPTINRFLKKLKDNDKLAKTRIGKKDFFKLK